MALRGIGLVADRTAVLAVGVVAGFAIGLSFGGGTPAAPEVAAPTAPATPTALVSTGTPERDAGLPPQVVRRVAATGRLRVGVFGDSFGNGVWSAMYRLLPPGEGYDVLQFSKEATGFTRYYRLDLTQRAREQVRAEPIDVAVICFGANDLNPMWKGNDVYPLLGPEWRRIVGERVDAFVKEVRATGAVVYWVGLPVVRDATMDTQLQQLDALFADHMRRLGVPFLDSRATSLDPTGHYNAHLADPKSGKLQLVRESDGLHMNGIGYARLVTPLAARVRVYDARVRRAAGRPAPAPTGTPRS